MAPIYAGVELPANMVVLAQSRRENGEILGLQTGMSLRTEGSLGVSSRSLALPSCVMGDEAAAMTVCMHAIASGEHTGVDFAEILQRAEVRCEVAHNIDGLCLSAAVASSVYSSAVAKMDEDFGWKSNFVSDVADLAVVIGVTSRVSGLGRVDELDSAVRSALNLKVVGQNVVVATPAVEQSADDVKNLHDDYRVVPMSIYRSLMRVRASVIGSAVCVSVSRSVDGVYRLENDFDCSSCYSISSLPLGMYALPGGFGRLVTSGFLRGLLESVIALPALKVTPGFCYIDVLPPSLRLKAAVLLGRNPSVMNLSNVFPEVYDWCSVEAQVKRTGFSGDNPNYHVVTAGVLPAVLPQMARVGMADRHASDLSAHTDKLLNDIFSGAMSAGSNDVAAPGIQHRLRQPGYTMYTNQAVDKSAGVSVVRSDVPRAVVNELPPAFSSYETRLLQPSRPVGRHTRSVSDSGLMLSNRVVLDMGSTAALRPVWEDVNNPRARMWVSRLGEGAPIDPRKLIELSKVKSSDDLPVPPASVSGTSVMVRPCSVLGSDGGKLISWDSRAIAVPGCYMEYSKLASNKGKRFLSVHPSRGVICRYDLSFDRTVVVNGSINVSSTDCVLWLHGDVSFNIIGSGSVVRTWFDDGMPGLGAMVTSMVFSFQTSAIRRYGGEIHAERVIGLELKSVDQKAGLVRFHKRFRMRPNTEKIHLYAFDEVVAEPVLLVVQASGLRYIVVHGTRVPADGCQATVVVLDAQTTVKICVEATGESTTIDAQMVFIRESQRYASHVGHNVLSGSVGHDRGGRSASLFIEG